MPRSPLARLLVVAAVVGGLTAPAAFVYYGVYDVAATRQHTPPVYWLLISSLHRSIKARAPQEVPPPPQDLGHPARVDEGLVLYDANCAVCHGAPGQAPHPLGLGMTPPPSNLVIPGRDWTPRELFWTIEKGLKMTGMPAWEFRMSPDERWSIVAFLKAMPSMAPSGYAEHRARLRLTGELAAGPRDEDRR